MVIFEDISTQQKSAGDYAPGKVLNKYTAFVGLGSRETVVRLDPRSTLTVYSVFTSL